MLPKNLGFPIQNLVNELEEAEKTLVSLSKKKFIFEDEIELIEEQVTEAYAQETNARILKIQPLSEYWGFDSGKKHNSLNQHRERCWKNQRKTQIVYASVQIA